MATTNTWVGAGDVRITGQGTQTTPAAATLAGGATVFVWIDTSTGTGQVHGQVFDPNGNKFGAEMVISAAPAGGVPAVSATAEGGFVVTWDSRSDPFAPTNYLSQHFNGAGVAISAPVQANALPNFDPSTSSDITALAGGGYVVEWWQDPGGPTFWGPQIQVYGANGAAVGGNHPIGYEADGTPVGTGTFIHAADTFAMPDGGFIEVWAVADPAQAGGTTNHVWYQRFDANGGVLFGPAEVATDPASVLTVNDVAVTVLRGSGNIVIATTGTLPDGRSEIVAQPYNASGQPLPGAQAIVSNTEILQSKITALVDGSFVVSWLDSSGVGDFRLQTLYAQRFDATGARLGDQVLVGTSQAVVSHYSVTATSDGGAVFGWDDGRTDAGDVITQKFATNPAGDVVAPIVTGFSPKDEAVKVGVNVDHVNLTFSEAVLRGGGAIALHDAAGNVIANYPPGSPGVAISGATVTVFLPNPLAAGTAYGIDFAPGSFTDLAGNPYAGTTTYNFTTDPGTSAPPPPPPPPAPPPAGPGPTAVDFFPTAGSSTLPPDWNIGITFNETVQAGAGTITLQTAAGQVVQTFAAASDPGIQFVGSSLVINPTADLLAGTTYKLIIAPGAVQDLAGNAYAGENNYTFTTAGAAPPPPPPPPPPAPPPSGPGPTVVDFFPTAGSSTLPPDWNIGITFNTSVKAGAGSITLQTAAGQVVQTFAAAGDPGVQFIGSSLVINPTADLQPGTTYKLVIAPGAVQDLAGNAYAGENNYTFTTAGGAPAPGGDTTAPTAVDFFPAPGSNTLPPDWNIGITFSEAVKAGAGSITLQTAAGQVVQTFAAASDPGIQFIGSSLVINPAADLLPGTTYKLIVAPGAVLDLAGNAYAGESSYSFTAGLVGVHPA